jgi:hypothetical protein
LGDYLDTERYSQSECGKDDVHQYKEEKLEGGNAMRLAAGSAEGVVDWSGFPN